MSPGRNRPKGHRAATILAATLMAAALLAPARAQPVASTVVAELPNPMPPVPKAGKLVEFEFRTTSRHHFAIDPGSMLLRGNEILQLTIVVTSSGGSTNASYEAFDCKNTTHRLLAVAGVDGNWQPVENSPWVTVRTSDQVLRQHYAVFKAACSGGGLSGGREDILRRLVNPPNELYYSQ